MVDPLTIRTPHPHLSHIAWPHWIVSKSESMSGVGVASISPVERAGAPTWSATRLTTDDCQHNRGPTAWRSRRNGPTSLWHPRQQAVGDLTERVRQADQLAAPLIASRRKHGRPNATGRPTYSTPDNPFNRLEEINHSVPRGGAHPQEPDTLSLDSTDSLRVQLWRVSKRLDKVHKEVTKSKQEASESSKCGSPFAPEIQDKPIPTSFRLPALESYDGSSDPTEHVAAFRAHMALYDSSDALMCQVFPTTLRGPARMWYSRLRPASIFSFDQLTKELEQNFLASARPKPIIASLLGIAQGREEPLAQFINRFAGSFELYNSKVQDSPPELRGFLGVIPNFGRIRERAFARVGSKTPRSNSEAAWESSQTLVVYERFGHRARIAAFESFGA
ncbi:hypothetical protein B296_00046107 [Ensete ventricosum]|uniref:Retrotransposon gag domain-containing protein n=1 Tax=Ensete ventricosum TaxID=4639 RepID=A0A426XLD9_ENSVE|nr:hypothetical protein B296_00046107 [Ensete ventricosum]